MIEINGSSGEGGGQILRSSLSLSVVTGKPFRLFNLRAGRRKPGLLRQHLTAFEAATAISNAEVRGNKIGSTEIEFHPGGIQPGDYTFQVGTAGSATLVLQTVLPPLLIAPGPSTLVVEGGTHNPWAPPYNFLAKCFVPVVNRMGPHVDMHLEKHGFYPAGGGKIKVEIKPTDKLKGLDLCERGAKISQLARVIIANLPLHIAEREIAIAKTKLNWPDSCLILEEIPDANGPGNLISLEVDFENITEVFTGFGEVKRRAEQVATHAIQCYQRYLRYPAPVGEYLADQLMLPFALAGSGQYRSTRLTKHASTNLEIIHKFLDIKITADDMEQDGVLLRFDVP